MPEFDEIDTTKAASFGLRDQTVEYSTEMRPNDATDSAFNRATNDFGHLNAKVRKYLRRTNLVFALVLYACVKGDSEGT